MKHRGRVARVKSILARIARRFFGGARKVIRIGRESLKKTATKDYLLLLGIIRKAGLQKCAELAKIAGKPGSWKEGEWKSFAKGFFKDYFEKVGEEWNEEQRLPGRYLTNLAADIYMEFKP